MKDDDMKWYYVEYADEAGEAHYIGEDIENAAEAIAAAVKMGWDIADEANVRNEDELNEWVAEDNVIYWMTEPQSEYTLALRIYHRVRLGIYDNRDHVVHYYRDGSVGVAISPHRAVLLKKEDINK